MTSILTVPRPDMDMVPLAQVAPSAVLHYQHQGHSNPTDQTYKCIPADYFASAKMSRCFIHFSSRFETLQPQWTIRCVC